MKNIVAYGLYSNEKEVEEFKKQIKNEMEKNKDWNLGKIYIDYGTKQNNEELMTMLNDTFEEKKDIILIKNTKQFFKVIHNMEFVIKYLEKEKIEIKFLDENISTFDAESKIQFLMMFWLDRNERQRRARRTKHTLLITKEEFNRTKKSISDKKSIENASFEEQQKFLTEELKNNPNCKIIGYDYINGKYIANEKESKLINKEISKEIKKVEKEEQRKQANKSRSEKMKERWQNEDYRQEMSKRIRLGKKLKGMEGR